MGTIEYNDYNFREKFKIMEKILALIDNNQLKILYKNTIEDYFNITKIIINYYINPDKNNYNSEFNHTIIKYSINDNLRKMMYIVNKAAKQNNTEKLRSLINTYYKIPPYTYAAAPKKSKNRQILCADCGNELLQHSTKNETICSNCAIIMPVIDPEFEYIETANQECGNPKKTSYERFKHGEKWLSRIQGKEQVDISNDIINKIKRQLINRQIDDISQVTCDIIRDCLQKIGCTQYNENIVYIKYKIINQRPPQLTIEEENKTKYYMREILKIFESIKTNRRQNLPYHAYFIYKILQQKSVMAEDTEQNYIRKKKILSNIHLQSNKTVCHRDKLWKVICAKIPEFTYMSTSRARY